MIKNLWVLFAFVLLTACGGNTAPSNTKTQEAIRGTAFSASDASGSLTATNEITVSWGAAESAQARYELIRTSQSDCQVEVNPESCADFKFLQTQETTLVDSDLPWGNTYYYFLRVGRTDNNRVDRYFALANAVVPVVAPRQVDLIMSGTSGKLNWDYLPDVTYSLLISHDGNCDTASIKSCEGGQEIKEKAPNSLQPLLDIGKNYYFWVKAERNGYIDITKTAVHKFLDPFSPVEFKVLQKGRDLGLEWNAERNTNYAVRRWSNCSSEPSLSALSGDDGSAEKLCLDKIDKENVTEPFTDTDVTPGTAYYYAVEASAGGKTAKRSGLVKGVLNAPLPTDFTVKVMGASSIVGYTIDEQFPSIKYAFYRSDDTNCNVSQFSSCSDSNTATGITPGYVDENLKGNRNYGYWLEASIGEAKNYSPVNIVTTGSILLEPTGSRDLIEVDDGKCLLESESGLRWAKLTEADGVVGGLLFDADDQYEFATETDTGRAGDSCGSGKTLIKASSCGTADVIKRFNEAEVCGKNNWRLPTLTELLSIVDYTQDTDGKSAFFPSMGPSETPFEYWTADANADKSKAIALRENGGVFGLKDSSQKLKVRLVSPGIK